MRRLDEELTGLQDAFRVRLTFAAAADDRLVAGPLTFRDEACADPPDEWVKPEDDLDGEMKQGGQVVMTPQVTELVCENSLELLIAESFAHRPRPQQHGTNDTENSGLEKGVGNHQRNRLRVATAIFERAQYLDLAPP
jgi:hypothetical protein